MDTNGHESGPDQRAHGLIAIVLNARLRPREQGQLLDAIYDLWTKETEGQPRMRTNGHGLAAKRPHPLEAGFQCITSLDTSTLGAQCGRAECFAARCELRRYRALFFLAVMICALLALCLARQTMSARGEVQTVRNTAAPDALRQDRPGDSSDTTHNMSPAGGLLSNRSR